MEITEKNKEEEREGRVVKWRGEVPLPPIPDTNYASFVLEVLSQYGGKTALVDAGTGKHHTFQDVCAMVLRVCAGLSGAGVRACDAVLLVASNHIDYPIVQLATMLLPATCVPINPALSAKEVAYLARMSGARWVVAEEGVMDMVKQLPPLLPYGTLRQVWVMGHARGTPSFASLMRAEVTQPPAQDPNFDPRRAVALMMFSSGTTGVPKGVMLSHRNLLTQFLQNRYLHAIKTGGDPGPGALDATLLMLPVFHSYGYCIMMNCLSVGGRVFMLPKFSPRSFLEAIQKHKITYTPIVPHIAAFLATSSLVEEYDISSLVAFGSGSSTLPTSTALALLEKTGRGIGEGYGLTETIGAVSVNNPAIGYKFKSVGHILPYVEVKIVGPGSSKGLGVGEEGEVWVRGPGVMLGYTATTPGDPTSSPVGLKEGGWFPTGDMGHCDEENFLFLTDRIKDLIKVKGYQVSPSELEGVLRQVKGVSDVAVVGVPSARYGEMPRAWVVPAPGASLTPQQLEDYVAERVSPYKRLSGGVVLVEDLPKNAIGKILKRKLREDYRSTESKL